MCYVPGEMINFEKGLGPGGYCVDSMRGVASSMWLDAGVVRTSEA